MTLPIESPSQEWIERATEFFERVEIIILDDDVIEALAREFSSIYEAGVKRERERCAAVLRQVGALDDESDLGERAADAFNADPVRRPMNERLRDWNNVLADGLTPSPSEGERG